MTVVVPLTRGYEAVIDDEDAERVLALKWQVRLTQGLAYATRGYWDGKAGQISLHRFILTPPKRMVVDHIDRDGLNNRRSNLRICTQQQNSWNTRRRCDNSSGFRGVYFKGNRRIAYIKINKVMKYLGTFDSAEIAAEARDRAAIKLHGEFAPLNFPVHVNQSQSLEERPARGVSLISGSALPEAPADYSASENL